MNGPFIWKKITDASQLNLRNTLLCGQCFRWNQTVNSEWIGVYNKQLILLKEQNNEILFSNTLWNTQTHSKEEGNKLENSLSDYFNLQYNITDLYQKWENNESNSEISIHFRHCSSKLGGLRLLRQDPLETLFSFICSQNNNIPRIKSLIEKICIKYGDYITTFSNVDYYSFPDLAKLQTATEDELNALGFGYRSKYIVKAVEQVIQLGGSRWLDGLRLEPSIEKVSTELQTLHGVGQKVADCIALFSLDKLDLVPIDTHVFQIAQRFIPSLKNKSLNKGNQKEIKDFFNTSFDNFTGWAHTVLFAAELPVFLPEITTQKKVKKERKRKASTIEEVDEFIIEKEEITQKSKSKKVTKVVVKNSTTAPKSKKKRIT